MLFIPPPAPWRVRTRVQHTRNRTDDDGCVTLATITFISAVRRRRAVDSPARSVEGAARHHRLKRKLNTPIAAVTTR